MGFNEAKSSSPDPLDILSSSKSLYLTPNCRGSLNLAHQKLELSTDIRRIGLYVDIGSDREEVFFVSPRKTRKHTGTKTCTNKPREIKDDGNSDISSNETVSSCKKILDGKKKEKKRRSIKQKKRASDTPCLNTDLASMQDAENILEADIIKEIEKKDFNEKDACLYNNIILRERKNDVNDFYFNENVMEVDDPEIISFSSMNELVKKPDSYTTSFCKKQLNMKKQEKIDDMKKILDSTNVNFDPNTSIEPDKSVFPKKDILIEVSSLSKASAERAANALTLTGKFESIQNKEEDSSKSEEIFQEKRCWTKDEWKLLELLLIKHKKIKKVLNCFLKVNSNFPEEEVDKRLKVLIFKKKENYYLHIDRKNKLNKHTKAGNNRVSNSVFGWKNWLKW